MRSDKAYHTERDTKVYEPDEYVAFISCKGN